MDVKQAVEAAKAYFRKAFEEENVAQIRLEEVEFDEVHDAWLITLGVLRPPVSTGSHPLDKINIQTSDRSYKIIRISNRGETPSIKIRELGVDA